MLSKKQNRRSEIPLTYVPKPTRIQPRHNNVIRGAATLFHKHRKDTYAPIEDACAGCLGVGKRVRAISQTNVLRTFSSGSLLRVLHAACTRKVLFGENFNFFLNHFVVVHYFFSVFQFIFIFFHRGRITGARPHIAISPLFTSCYCCCVCSAFFVCFHFAPASTRGAILNSFRQRTVLVIHA